MDKRTINIIPNENIWNFEEYYVEDYQKYHGELIQEFKDKNNIPEDIFEEDLTKNGFVYIGSLIDLVWVWLDFPITEKQYNSLLAKKEYLASFKYFKAKLFNKSLITIGDEDLPENFRGREVDFFYQELKKMYEMTKVEEAKQNNDNLFVVIIPNENILDEDVFDVKGNSSHKKLTEPYLQKFGFSYNDSTNINMELVNLGAIVINSYSLEDLSGSIVFLPDEITQRQYAILQSYERFFMQFMYINAGIFSNGENILSYKNNAFKNPEWLKLFFKFVKNNTINKGVER